MFFLSFSLILLFHFTTGSYGFNCFGFTSPTRKKNHTELDILRDHLNKKKKKTKQKMNGWRKTWKMISLISVCFHAEAI